MSTAARTAHETNRSFYEDAATTRYYTDLSDLTPAERSLFDRHLRPGMDILDLGVGAGRTTPYLSGLARTYVGLDYAAPMVDVCRQRFPSLAFHHADAADLAFLEAASFDAVIFSYNGIDYLSPAAQRRRCLEGCHRLLRPGGVLILSRHNPRAVVRLPRLAGRGRRRQLRLAATVPLWALRRSVRMVPHRSFWAGQGPLREAPQGFTYPLVFGRRRLRADSRGAVLTHMAVPRAVADELRRSGFTVTEVAGGVNLPRTWTLSTPFYYYVATKPVAKKEAGTEG